MVVILRKVSAKVGLEKPGFFRKSFQLVRFFKVYYMLHTRLFNLVRPASMFRLQSAADYANFRPCVQQLQVNAHGQCHAPESPPYRFRHLEYCIRRPADFRTCKSLPARHKNRPVSRTKGSPILKSPHENCCHCEVREDPLQRSPLVVLGEQCIWASDTI